jgi:hypothetical protein
MFRPLLLAIFRWFVIQKIRRHLLKYLKWRKVRTVKNFYLEEVYLNGTKCSKTGSEYKNANIVSEKHLMHSLCWRYLTIRIWSGERDFNGKFLTEVIKRLVAQVHRVRPEFPESGSWYLLQDNTPAHSSGVVSEFLAKRTIPVLSHPLYSPHLAPAGFIS